MTCARMDTPSGLGGAVGARFTFPRCDNDDVSDDEEPADHSDSDGEGLAIPCPIPNRLTLRPLAAPIANRGVTGTGDSRKYASTATEQESKNDTAGNKKRERKEHPMSGYVQKTQDGAVAHVGTATVEQ